MPANPYHCWAHVADVTQAVYAIGLLSGALDTMPDGERLALLMAALCHDVEHPVRTWTFSTPITHLRLYDAVESAITIRKRRACIVFVDRSASACKLGVGDGRRHSDPCI